MELTTKALIYFADKNDFEITEAEAERIISNIRNHNSYGKISKEDVLAEISDYIDSNYFIIM